MRRANSSSVGSFPDSNEVQVKSIQEEFMYSVPNFSSMFPNIFLEGGESGDQLTAEDQFKLIKQKMWESKKLLRFRLAMMAETEETMLVTTKIRTFLRKGAWGGGGGIVLVGGTLVFNLSQDQQRGYISAAGNRRISFKADVVNKTGMPLHETGSLWSSTEENDFSGLNETIEMVVVRFELAPLKTLWENHELYFPNDVLNVKITLLNTWKDATVDKLILLPQSYKCLSDDMLTMFHSSQGADFEIVCKAWNKFPVHKSILASRSPVFSRMLATDMKEKESKSLSLDDVEPNIMKLLLEYIYSSKIELQRLDFEAVLDLGALADKYQILELKDHCFGYAADRINLKSAGQLAIIVYKHSANEASRSKVFDYCAANWKELCTQPEFQVLVCTCPAAFVNEET